MNLEITMKRISKKYGFEYTIQPMEFEARRVEIKVDSWRELEYIESILTRMKSVKFTNWTCFGGGVFEGYVYVWERSEYDRYKNEQALKTKANYDWWNRYAAADVETRRLMACGKIE